MTGFTVDPITGKISFGVVADGTNDGIAIDLASQFGVSEDFKENFTLGIADFSDDFAGTDDWTDVGTGFGVNLANDVMDVTGKKNNANNSSGFDLGVGNVSDTNWVLRFKIDLTSLPAVTTDDSALYLSVDSADQSVGANSTGHDALTLQIAKSATTGDVRWVPFSSDGGTVFETVGTTLFTNEVGPIRYVEIKRTSSTSATWTVFSDASFTTILARSTNTIASGITDLRHIVFRSRSDGTAGTGEIVGEIDDVQFYNKIIPLLWTSSTSGKYTINDTNDNIDFDAINGTNDTIVYDLGSGNVADTWTLRFKMRFSTLSAGVATNAFFGMSDSDETEGAVTVQNHIMIRVNNTTDSGGVFWLWWNR